VFVTPWTFGVGWHVKHVNVSDRQWLKWQMTLIADGGPVC